MLHLLTVGYARFVTKVNVQESQYRPIADRRGVQEVEPPIFPDIWHVKVVKVASPSYSFLVFIFAMAELNLGPYCGLLVYVYEKV